MGRYSEKYWTEGASEALAAIVTGGLSMLMDGETEFYGCEITDNETGLIGTTHRGCSSKIKAHDDAWEDLMKKQENYYEKQEEDYKKEREVKYNRTQGGSENRLIELLIKGIVYVLIFVAIVWLIFSVAIPLLVINISAITFIVGLAIKKTKKYLFPLSVFATIYLMFDYNKGWFTKALATNVPFLSGLIPFFYYLNMVTGLVAAFFIINDLAYKKIPQVTEDTKFLKRDMVILVSFYSFFAFTLWLDKYLRYKMPIQNNSSISNTNENSQTTKQQEQLPTTTQQVQAPINTQYEQIQNTQHQNADEAFYIICAYSVKTESQAKIKVAELKNDGYTSAYLWIPDYPSLSGAQFYSVYIGPFTTQYDCEVATEEYRKKYPKAYGLLVSNEKKRIQINGLGKVTITEK